MGKRLKNIILSLILSSTFLCALSACNEAKKWGEFYIVKEAYENGNLTKEDLQNLADAYNSYVGKNDEFDWSKIGELDEKTAKMIKQTELQRLKDSGNEKANLNAVHINRYYGKYGDCFAIFVSNDYEIVDILSFEEYFVADVKFCHFDNYSIQLWRANKK